MSRYDLIVEAVGPERAEQLIVQEFGSVDEVFKHLVATGFIDPSEEQ